MPKLNSKDTSIFSRNEDNNLPLLRGGTGVKQNKNNNSNNLKNVSSGLQAGVVRTKKLSLHEQMLADAVAAKYLIEKKSQQEVEVNVTDRLSVSSNNMAEGNDVSDCENSIPQVADISHENLFTQTTSSSSTISTIKTNKIKINGEKLDFSDSSLRNTLVSSLSNIVPREKNSTDSTIETSSLILNNNDSFKTNSVIIEINHSEIKNID